MLDAESWMLTGLCSGCWLFACRWLVTVTLDWLIDWLHYSILNCGHWTLDTLRLNWTLNTGCFLPYLGYSPIIYRTSIRVKLQSLTCNVFNCSLLWKHSLFWLAVWLVTNLFVVAETCLEKPLPSYSCTFQLQYSSFQAAYHNIYSITSGSLWVHIFKF
jgi:hypothetical protein